VTTITYTNTNTNATTTTCTHIITALKGCINFMKSRCTPEFQKQALMMSHDDKYANQSIAAFLITRPPIAFLGYGWESDDRNWKDIFLLQVGTPTGICSEGPPGVFKREWTAGTAELDCNTYTATLPFPSL